MKKILSFIVVITIILIIIFIAIKDNFNLNKIIIDIEKKTDLTITLNNESKWKFYPLIKFYNNITIKDKTDILLVNAEQFCAMDKTPPRYLSEYFSLKLRTDSLPDFPRPSQKIYSSIILSPIINIF